MASNGGNEKLFSGKDEVNWSEATVEIKIKTLDSQTYTMRVDKRVPVPALKEQIASVTGVLSERQRLICRGKVLKDDQLLSAYHVEDGHTLHLVVRQPVATSSENPPNPDCDPASTTGHSQGSGGPGILVGSFNVSELDGAVGVGRIVSALLSSLAVANSGSGSEGIDLNELPSERVSNAATLRNLSRQRPELTALGQSIFDSGAFSPTFADPVESLQASVIPDSLATLLQNSSLLRQGFTANAEALSSSDTARVCGTGGQSSDASSSSTVQRGLPTPASLAEILLTTRQVLNEQVAECLLLLARQLEGHANVVDALERVRIQNNAARSGALFHNLGALLLELARTTITLRMGHSPGDAIVNAGPAVFISSAGPNPIMVQPLSFQPGIGFGPSGGIYQPSSGVSAASGGSGVLRRNIDIRIQRVAVPSAANRRDSTRSQNVGQTDPGVSSNGNSAREAAARGSGVSASGESDMRSVLTAVPAHGGHTTTESSRGTMGILFPLVSRVQRVATGGLGHSRAATGAQTSDEPHGPGVEAGSQSIPDIGVELQNLGTLGVDGSSTGPHGEHTDNPGMHAQLRSRIERLLRSILPGEQDHADRVNPPRDTEANSVTQNENSEAAASAAAVSDEGAFFSSVLQQLMPLILERGGSDGLNDSSSDVNMEEDPDGQESMRAAQGSGDGGGSSSRRPDDAALQPEAKRQKRE